MRRLPRRTEYLVGVGVLGLAAVGDGFACVGVGADRGDSALTQSDRGQGLLDGDTVGAIHAQVSSGGYQACGTQHSCRLHGCLNWLK